MRILWLYKYSSTYNIDHWFHMDFARQIQTWGVANGVELRAFGPDLHVLYSDMIVCHYNPKTTLQDIKTLFDFDVVVLCTKSRMFEYYNPHTDKAHGCWLPSDIATYQCPKVVLEEDYHYEKSDDWYKKLGINLVIQRHYANYMKQLAKGEMATCWLPFSVNTETFKPAPTIIRTPKIAFAGSAGIGPYPLRHAGVALLKTHGLIHDFGNRAKDHLYIECLQSYISHFCCSSIYNITPAKIFEIMASGSVLLINASDKYGMQQLFSSQSYIAYNEDLSDLIHVAKQIIAQPERQQQIVDSALQEIQTKHTDQIRIAELIQLLGRMTNGTTF